MIYLSCTQTPKSGKIFWKGQEKVREFWKVEVLATLFLENFESSWVPESRNKQTSRIKVSWTWKCSAVVQTSASWKHYNKQANFKGKSHGIHKKYENWKFFLQWRLVKTFFTSKSGSIPNDNVNEWRKNFPYLYESCELKNIFKVDKTGLFYKKHPSKTLEEKNVLVENILKLEFLYWLEPTMMLHRSSFNWL